VLSLTACPEIVVSIQESSPDSQLILASKTSEIKHCHFRTTRSVIADGNEEPLFKWS
jgi:hypothetical protein